MTPPGPRSDRDHGAFVRLSHRCQVAEEFGDSPGVLVDRADLRLVLYALWGAWGFPSDEEPCGHVLSAGCWCHPTVEEVPGG